MNYLYLCFSGTDTLSAEQLAIMSESRVDKAFLEVKAGKRDALDGLLGQLQSGDCVIAENFASVAGSSKAFLSLMAELAERGVDFRSVGEDVDTRTERGKLLLELCDELRLLDGKHRRDRQREGIGRARKDGKYKGRKPIAVDEDKLDEAIERWQRGEITAKQAMKEVDLKPNTFYRRVKAKEGTQ